MLPLFFFQMKEGWAGLSAQLMWLSLVQPPCIKKQIVGRLTAQKPNRARLGT